MARKICVNCKREMQDTNFYTKKGNQKFDKCKTCLTLHLDNFDESTFLWILEQADVPYVPQEWNVLRDKAYAKNPNKMNGMSVIGKYLSKMKLKQWKMYHWSDSEKLQEQYRKKQALVKQAEEAAAAQAQKDFQNGVISEAQYRTLTGVDQQRKNQENIAKKKAKQKEDRDPIGEDNMFDESQFLSQDDLPSLADDLTLEDKQYLAMKWGRTYRATDWIQLEKTYNDMMNSFDIQDADSKNTLIFICKTILKMNQALDCGDLEGYQKLSRVYDALRKSAKFTAAQNKEEKHDFIDSVGQLVAFCQKNGHKIPRFKIEEPLDRIDKIIDDLKKYTRDLIYEDSALARQIEDYLKEVKATRAKKKDEEQAKEKGLEYYQIKDEDIADYTAFLLEQKQITEKEMKGTTQ